MIWVKRILSEPLLHFIVMGATVFFAYSNLNSSSEVPQSENRIVVTLQEVSTLASRFEGTWQRPPTSAELDRLIETHIRDRILISEALALSMDQDDPIINRRLVQKMDFLMQSVAGAATASEQELETYYAKNKQTYATLPMIAFEQVYFGEAPDPVAFNSALASLAKGTDPTRLGQETMLPARIKLSPAPTIDGMFGDGFFELVSKQSSGDWYGPVRSGFGVHIVRVTDQMASIIPEFEAVRSQLETDYATSMASRLSQNLFDEMRKRYEISQPADSELLELQR